MSLDYDLRRVADRNILHNTETSKGAGDRPHPEGSPEDIEGNVQWNVTQAVVFRSMYVGMGTITEKNYEKFFLRCEIAERVIGAPLINGDGTDRSLTLADIKRRIGLSTNVAMESDAKFKARVFGTLERDASNVLRSERRKLEEKETDAA